MRKLRLLTIFILACCYLLASARLVAQHGPGGPPPPGGGGPPFGNQGPGGPPGPGIEGPMGPPPSSPEGGRAAGPMRGGLQLGPPGRWWDDRGFAKSLGLRPEQKNRMDDIFNANKSTILQRYQSLQQEELRLEDATRAAQLDEATIFTAIDRVAQARAALEKANAHMLLLIRGEMSKEQIERLEQYR